ncbi:MAG: MFS transporter [Thermoguttaceae bacterium]|jgi:fucose permease|nr:MFS transporter [Thermoguttaceae bacterium]
MEKVVVFLCVMGLGLCFSLWGAVSVKLMPRLGIDRGQFGTLISVFMGSCLVFSLVMGVVVDSMGYLPVAVFGFAVTSFCLFLLARARTFPLVLAIGAVLGPGAMALNTVGNTLNTVVLFGGQNPPAALNLTNVFFGAGILLTPLVVSSLFQRTTYEWTLSVLAAAVLLPVAAAVTATYPDSKVPFKFSDAVGLLDEPGLWVGGLVLFCCFSLDTTLKSWLAPFGKEVIGREHPEREVGAVDASALQLLVWFAAAMMLSRLLASNVSAIKDYGAWFVAGAGVVSGIVILTMLSVARYRRLVILAALAGFAFGLSFPTTVGVTYSKFPQEVRGSVFGIIFAVGLLGSVIMPKAIGNLATGSSVQKSLKLLLPLCVLQVVLALVLGWI